MRTGDNKNVLAIVVMVLIQFLHWLQTVYISVPELYNAIHGGQIWQEFTLVGFFLLALISCGTILSKTAI